MGFPAIQRSITNVFMGSLVNFFDLIILITYILYSIEEMSYGVYESFVHLCGIIIAFLIGISTYGYVSFALQSSFSMPKGAGDAISFFLTAVPTYFIVLRLIEKVAAHKAIKVTHFKINKIGAFAFGSISFFLIASFITTIILSFPISEYVKNQIRDSFSGNIFFLNSEFMEGSIKGVFGGAVNDTINFLTIKPASDDSVNLNFKTKNVSTDTQSEEKMLKLINIERTKRGFAALETDPLLQEAARLHAKDMFARGYFSHYTPDGFSPFDRLSNKNVSYGIAAENLAYAPDVILAVHGLMKSPRHKATILRPQFKKVGIGVIDGKIYGKMFVQEFSD